METKNLSLYTGEYTPSEAQQILSKMFKDALQYHKLQNFTSVIRYDVNCDQAKENIDTICDAQDELTNIINLAKGANFHLQIEANLQVSFVTQPVEKKMVAYPCV